MYDIDCGMLVRAMKYYESLGYEPLSAPMLVDKDIVELTLPKGKTPREHLGRYYVGSAEQSFYQLMKDGFKPDGDYMMITPCERDEVEDELHLGIFLKLELVSTKKSDLKLMQDVSNFLCEENIGHRIEETEFGYDLISNGIEVGSYGYNSYKGVLVTYGTGLALPRISQAIKGGQNES